MYIDFYYLFLTNVNSGIFLITVTARWRISGNAGASIFAIISTRRRNIYVIDPPPPPAPSTRRWC